MGSRLGMLRLSLVAALAAGVVAASAMIVGVHPSSGSSSSAVDAGLVDVDTTLGYAGGTAAGTGIVVTHGGEVLTNNHVIRGATSIRVTVVGTGRSYGATVAGYSVAADIAVLKLKGASGLATASLGSASTLRLGAAVTAVGNAGGVGGRPTVTHGRVTALDQTISVQDGYGGAERLTGLIKSSARVQPGDSGGALLDASGRVVGIVTAASNSFEFQGGGSSGYAIPIGRANALASQVVAGKSSADVHVGPTAFLGVLTRSGDFSVQGALVERIVPGSAADKAGLEPGDVITALAGRRITSPTVLTQAVLRVKPGAPVQLRWLDGFGGSHSAVVRPAAGPPQ